MQNTTTTNISPDGQWAWNGAEWVPNPAASVAHAPQGPAVETPRKKRRLGLKITGGVLAALLAMGIGGALLGEDTTDPGAGQQDVGAPVEGPAVDETAQEAAPEMTVSQENAVKSARSYLGFSSFSRQGLIQQLTSEYGDGFSTADATFAVDHLEATGAVDWYAEAAEAAQSYLEFSSFSRNGLIRQLESEYGSGFTHDQAVHGADSVGL